MRTKMEQYCLLVNPLQRCSVCFPALTAGCVFLKSLAMSILKIVTLPDKLLRARSEPVTHVDAETRKLLKDMADTMYDAPGIGLAAIQIGVPRRLVVVDVEPKDETGQRSHNPVFLINPEVTWASEAQSDYEEGCLSIPEYYETVSRPAEVRVKYIDIDGQERELEAGGLMATCLQHEIDHLNGVLFIDYLSKLKRDRVLKRFQKLAKFQGA